MQRVVIVGTSGAGKTTLARRLAGELDAAFIELDALHWLENWTPNPEFAAHVAEALEAERWVVDGNYSRRVQDNILSRADTLVWLDYSVGTKLWWLVQRTSRRLISRETLWHGNRETLSGILFSRESLFVWFFKSHWSQRRRYGALLAEPPEHLTAYRLYKPIEAERLLAGIGQA